MGNYNILVAIANARQWGVPKPPLGGSAGSALLILSNVVKPRLKQNRINDQIVIFVSVHITKTTFFRNKIAISELPFSHMSAL